MNFNTVLLWPSLVSIFNGLADFRNFDNFSSFFFWITLLKIVAQTFRKVEKMPLDEI